LVTRLLHTPLEFSAAWLARILLHELFNVLHTNTAFLQISPWSTIIKCTNATANAVHFRLFKCEINHSNIHKFSSFLTEN
jgi:hypothetical protein